jgi:hypothetical protein
MSRPTHLVIDGRAYAWRELVERRKEQLKAAAVPEQPALFEMHEDRRHEMERTATGRYLQPGLFDMEPR